MGQANVTTTTAKRTPNRFLPTLLEYPFCDTAPALKLTLSAWCISKLENGHIIAEELLDLFQKMKPKF